MVIIWKLAIFFQNEEAIEKSLIFYNQKTYNPKLKFLVLAGVIRYHDKFLEIWNENDKHSLDNLVYLSATSNSTEQNLLISSYLTNKKALSIILEQFSSWGHYKYSWDIWKSNPFTIRIDLEKLVRQMIDTNYKNQAKLYALFSNEIQRGLERAKFNYLFSNEIQRDLEIIQQS